MISDTHVSGFSSDFVRPSSGSAVAQFTPDNICGEGATCVVYQMRLEGLRVAVKRLKAEQRGNPTYVAAYRKEYTIGRNLKHDSLPVYRELHADEDEVYIVMDYVDGISLEDFIQTDEGREYFSSVANVRRFLSELVNAVGYLHHSGVIHCDIKPANIMLRHSDRGVMLIDLDKSYSDILDLTHGGTPTISDPLDAGQKPTAQKDIAAIGRLMDVISDHAIDFPAKKFKPFRKACQTDGVNADNLNQILNTPSRSKWLLIAIGIGIILAIIISLIMGNKRTIESVVPYENTIVPKDTVVAKDTVIQIVKEPEQLKKQPHETKMVIDFDNHMSSFIPVAEDALRQLSDGSLDNREINDLVHGLVENYYNVYGNVVDESKAKYSRMSGTDVELAVGRASEKSRASKLLQQFTKAAADTMAIRTGDI